MQEFYIKEASWATHEDALRQIREQVFIKEQGVPITLEWDEYDQAAQHLLACDMQDNAIGCVRVRASGSIGRMAVLIEYRGMGVGKALLAAAIAWCQRRQIHCVTLSAQTHAISFYQAAGFTVCSDVYLDANIEHVDMQLHI